MGSIPIGVAPASASENAEAKACESSDSRLFVFVGHQMAIHTLCIGERTYEIDVRADGERNFIAIVEAGKKSAPAIELIRQADGALSWSTPHVSDDLREAIEEWAAKHFGSPPVG
jgi:hypothetical protein